MHGSADLFDRQLQFLGDVSIELVTAKRLSDAGLRPCPERIQEKI